MAYSCNNSEKKEAKQEKEAAIATFGLKKDKLSTALSLPGELIALQQVDLYAKVS
ncbi:MAG: efflux RND transporter periplasmic adaptor subunit, partial [Chitinophagaceae bacterium]